MFDKAINLFSLVQIAGIVLPQKHNKICNKLHSYMAINKFTV